MNTPFSAITRASTGEKNVEDRLKEFGDVVHHRLEPRFRELGINYPPQEVLLVGLKQERVLEVWVPDGKRDWQLLKTYPILGASGLLGPKLREGDKQVPEGLYQIASLNPNSRFHLALRVNYPNDFDKEKARLENRTNPGSDIMIHGSSVSIGCLAVGDAAAEDLFVLAAETRLENIELILSPVDFRIGDLPAGLPELPLWTSELYHNIRQALMPLKVLPQNTSASSDVRSRDATQAD